MLERLRGDGTPAQASDGRRGRLLRIASLVVILLAGIDYLAGSAISLRQMAAPALQMVFQLFANWLVRVLGHTLSPGSTVYWGYVASSFAVALGVYLLIRRRQRVTDQDRRWGLRDYLRFCFPASVWKQPSAWLDVRFFLVDVMVLAVCGPVFAVVSGAAIALQTEEVVSGLFDSAPLVTVGGTYPTAIAATIVMVLLADFFAYLVHFLQHKVKFLWEFHKIHHSAPVLHPLTKYRQHPVDSILNGWAVALSSGLGIGVGSALFGLFPSMVQIMGVAFLAFSFNLLVGNLRHSHVWLAWPPILGRIFGSPANHHIHHSAEERHWDKNYGGIFAIWDWMFGTLYLPRERETFRMGLADGTETEYNSILRLYGLPFVKIYQNAARRLGRGSA